MSLEQTQTFGVFHPCSSQCSQLALQSTNPTSPPAAVFSFFTSLSLQPYCLCTSLGLFLYLVELFLLSDRLSISYDCVQLCSPAFWLSMRCLVSSCFCFISSSCLWYRDTEGKNSIAVHTQILNLHYSFVKVPNIEQRLPQG